MSPRSARQPQVLLRWASLRDLRGRPFRSRYAALEHIQTRFKQAHQSLAGVYDGVLEPMYEWGGRAEFPFAFGQALSGLNAPAILDVSSELSFLPLYISNIERTTVVCVHPQPSHLQRFIEVSRVMSLAPPSVVPGDLRRTLPLEKSQFGAVMCVNGLDALSPSDWPNALREMWRVLVPGGHIVLTAHVAYDDFALGIPARQLPLLMHAINDVLGGGFASVPSVPRNCLTPRNPGFGLAPLRTDYRVIPRGWRGWRAGFSRPSIAGEGSARVLLALLRKPLTSEGAIAAGGRALRATPAPRPVQWVRRVANPPAA